MHYPFGLPVVDSADAVGLGVRGVVVSVEIIVPEDTGAAVTNEICTSTDVRNANETD